MTKTIKISGMMCAHCEQRVHAALSAIKSVQYATAKSDTGIAQVELSEEVPDTVLTEAIEDLGFEVISIN